MELMGNTTERGRQIEGEAGRWFLVHEPGSSLVGRNFRCKAGEIDLIFECVNGRGAELVFVEVRGRAPSGWVRGVESVTFPKLLRLARAIRIFLAGYRGTANSIRVDLLAWDGQDWTHLRNVWPLPG